MALIIGSAIVDDSSEYYLYDRGRDGRFTYVQWDHNESFGTTGDGTPLIANPFTFDVFWLPTNAGGGGGFPGIGGGPRPLLEKLWAVDDFKSCVAIPTTKDR